MKAFMEQSVLWEAIQTQMAIGSGCTQGMGKSQGVVSEESRTFLRAGTLLRKGEERCVVSSLCANTAALLVLEFGLKAFC